MTLQRRVTRVGGSRLVCSAGGVEGVLQSVVHEFSATDKETDTEYKAHLLISFAGPYGLQVLE